MFYTRGMELLSAVTSVFPVLVSSLFPMSYVSLSFMIHCPFKILYHVNNAYSANTYRSQLIYKKYKSFLHVGLSILCLLYTSPSPRDGLLSRMPSSA